MRPLRSRAFADSHILWAHWAAGECPCERSVPDGRRISIAHHITGIVFVHDVTERGEIIVSVEAVHAIIYSNQAHTLLSENLHDLTNLEIVTSHTAHVLHTDRVNLPGLHVSHHRHEARTVEAGAGDAIVGKVNSVHQVMASCVLLQQPFCDW